MLPNQKIVVMTALAVLVTSCGGGGSSGSVTLPPPTGNLSTGPATCSGSTAADFSCSGIDLRSRIPLTDMGGTTGNDVWGWADALTGNEYALMGMTNGTAFVDVTDPENPVYLGILPTETISTPWRDIKVYEDHAYIAADASGAHGMQVFDLTRLRDVDAPQTFIEDALYGDFGNAHNLAINEDSGFAYAVGTNTCNLGLHIIDITTPNNPLFAGCHDLFHVHDTHCVSYSGPDPDYADAEICANSAEDRVELVDVSDKSSTVSVASIAYAQTGFVHQGWFTEDHRFLLVGDELDERNFGVPTRTHVFDVSDLDAPIYVFAYEGPTTAIDHNLYVLGNRVFEANYTSGLRVLEFGDLANSELSEVAFFDTYPGSDAANFDGAWSVYPYLPSGNILVSDTSHGLFVLTPR
jgi:choice-of-anchor B domain-containing protein